MYIHAKAPIEQLLHNNHKHGSRPKYFNKNEDTYKNTGPPQATTSLPRPKVNSVQFDDSFDHIYHMDHNHENTHFIDTQEQDMENNEVEHDALYYEINDDFITEEELEHIHPDLDKKIISPTINSGIIKIHQNDPGNIIDDPEQLTPKWTQGKYNSSNYHQPLHNWMED